MTVSCTLSLGEVMKWMLCGAFLTAVSCTFSVGLSIKQMTLLVPSDRGHLGRGRKGWRSCWMAQGIVQYRPHVLVEQRGKVFQDCRHGFQCLKDLTSSKNSFTASVSGSPDFLFPFIRNTSLSAAARIPAVGGRSALNIPSTAVSRPGGMGPA